MILLKYKSDFIKFIFCSILLVISMLILTKIFNKNTNNMDNNSIITSNITYVDEETNVDVEYPRFKNESINKIITDSLYSYIKDFRNKDGKKNLEIRYNLNYIDYFVNVEYSILDSTKNISFDNMLFDINLGKLAYISSLYDENYLKNEILKIANDKYSNEVYNQIANDTVNNYSFIIKDDGIEVFFNKIKDYPSIKLDYTINNHKNDNDLEKQKYIIFAYADGPSDYTNDILNELEKNNSKATFFMTGKNMKYFDNLILEIYNSSSEIASHGYSHESIAFKSEDEIDSEISVTNSIFNEITHDKLKYYIPPYGDYNDYLNNVDIEVINYQIDSRDWLVKDYKKVFNNVVKNACDGCVVLMHDTYKVTLDATERLIPALNKLGYEVTSISAYKILLSKNKKGM